MINALFLEEAGNAFLMTASEFVESHAQVAIVCVDGCLPSGFRVVECHFSHAWQFLFCGVDDAQGNGIVLAC